jgi:hypothetical protein
LFVIPAQAGIHVLALDFLKWRIWPPELIQAGRNTGIHHNPKRKRGILGRTVRTQKRNPSLTFRVVISVNAQLQKLDSRLRGNDELPARCTGAKIIHEQSSRGRAQLVLIINR